MAASDTDGKVQGVQSFFAKFHMLQGGITRSNGDV
jgi:hypothetical protein